VQGATYTQAPTPTFTIASDIDLIYLNKGQTGNATITLMSINGFSGTVSLSTSLTPAVKHPPLISWSTNRVTLTDGGFGAAILSISAQSNTDKTTYSITVTGAAGSQHASLQITVKVIP
jgi:hypothetical protein